MKRPIKIIYLIVSSAPYGSNAALLNMMEILMQKDVEPMVIMSGVGGLCDKLKERGIFYKQLKYYYSIYPRLKNFRDFVLFIPILFRTLIYNFIAINQITRIAKDFNADLIHTNIGPLHIGYKAAMKLNIPHVWHIREYQDLYLGFHPLFTKNGFINKLHTDQNYPIAITKGLFEHYSMKKNASVIYDGVMKASQSQFNKQKEKYFLFVGRLEEAKGIRQLIEAFIVFAKIEREYKLLIAGEGTQIFKNDLLKLVMDAGMNNRINFLGFQSDVNNLMAQATALIVSSSFEGFGFTTVEAMFNGCIVIGKNSGGTKEILEKEHLGIMYLTNNELITAMHNVALNGIQKYYPIIKKAQKVATECYSCHQNADLVYKVYEDAMKNQNSYQIRKQNL